MQRRVHLIIVGVALLVVCIGVSIYAYASWSKVRKAHELVEEAVKYINNGDYDKAIKLLNEAIKIDPNYAPAYYNLGTAYGNEDQFHRYYKLPGETFTQAGHPEMQKKYELAVHYYTLLEEKFPKYKALAEFGLGNVGFLYYCGYVNREKYVLPHYLYALKHVDEIRKFLGKEGVSALYTNLARVYLAMAEVKKAEEWYIKAISVYPDPGIDTAYEHLAWVELELGNITGALKVAEEYIEHAKKYGWDEDLGLMPASISAYLLGYYDKAFKYAEKIVKDFPDSAYVGEAYRIMAQIYHLRGDDADAIKMLKKDIQNCINAMKHPEDATTVPTAKYEEALALYLLYKLTGNKTALNECIKNLEWIISNPKVTNREVAHRNYYILSHLSLASIYSELHQFDKAASILKHLQNELNTNPNMQGWRKFIGGLVSSLIEKVESHEVISMPKVAWILSH